MRGVRLLLLDRFAAHIVETQHQLGIAGVGFGRRHVLDPVLFPYPHSLAPAPVFGTAKGVDPAFGGDSRAGQDHDVFHQGFPSAFVPSLSKHWSFFYLC